MTFAVGVKKDPQGARSGSGPSIGMSPLTTSVIGLASACSASLWRRFTSFSPETIGSAALLRLRFHPSRTFECGEPDAMPLDSVRKRSRPSNRGLRGSNWEVKRDDRAAFAHVQRGARSPLDPGLQA